jgi:hypothetical protein
MKENPNCDGQGNRSCSINQEVRSLPLGGGANAILCKHHFEIEMAFRREQKRDAYDIVKWGSLTIYPKE